MESNFHVTSDQDYHNGYFGFPDDNIPFGDKFSESWALANQKAIYSFDMMGYNMINNDDRAEMLKARRYADAKQDPDIYIDKYLFPALGKNQDFKGGAEQEILRKGSWTLPKYIFSIA